MPSPRRYLLRVAAVLVSSLALVAVCNGVVDPYDVYGAPRIDGFNAVKVTYEDRLHKAAMVSRARPDAVLLGSSRVQYCLDPEDPVFRGLAERTYNLGLLGASVYQLRRYLEHAQAISPLRFAILGLDFLMWSEHIETTGYARSFQEDRLAVDSRGRPSAIWPATDLASTLLSLDALRMSIATIRKQRSAIDELLPTGMRNPRDIERRIREHGGARAHFLHSERMYAEQYRHLRASDERGRSRASDDFRRILAFTREHDIRLVAFLTPNHARLSYLEWAMGLGPQIEAWKRELTSIVAEENARRRDHHAVHLLDLSTPLPHSEEPVPSALDRRSRLHFFSDSGHCTPALGRELLATLTARRPTSARFPTGGRLTPETIDHALASAREHMARYAESHPTDVAEIERIVLGRARNLRGGD